MSKPLVDCDTLIIGAGLIGSSVAMHLSQKQPGLDLHVVDFDLEGTYSSSELNAGAVRATWHQPVNIEASKLTLGYFSSIAEDVGFRACGYLWLMTPEKDKHVREWQKILERAKWPTNLLDIPSLQRQVPFLDKTEGIGLALFSPNDGLINPNLLKGHYREKAKANGVRFEDRILVRGAQYEKGFVRIEADRFERVIYADDKLAVMSGEKGALQGTKIEFRAKRVINCAGAWAPEIAQILKYPCPSKPIRRQVCIFDSRDVDLTPYGMIVDTSGVYFHPEATNGLAGFATPGEAPGLNFNYDGESFFTDIIWPALYERSTKFERLRHITGWSGLYEVSPDESAIFGRVQQGEAGKFGQIFEAHSYSGHGVMHSYAAGLGMAELLVNGKFETLDLSSLNGDRFDRGAFVREGMVI